MSELERLQEEYDAAVERRHGKIGATGLEIRADALITALEAEVALRDRMLRDIIERIALTPERWNGRTTRSTLHFKTTGMTAAR